MQSSRINKVDLSSHGSVKTAEVGDVGSLEILLVDPAVMKRSKEFTLAIYWFFSGTYSFCEYTLIYADIH